jgi:predicted alpha/beta hydrolase
MTPIELRAGDGTPLAACLHRHDAPRGVVLVTPATGVRQDCHADFAAWLARQGYSALTFGHRGVGASRPPPMRHSLRGFEADLFDWAADSDAAVEHLLAHAPDVPLFAVGHSPGAQLPGMLRRRDRIAGLVSVAAGSGYWRENAPPLKRMVQYFWHVVVPLATWVFGHLPGTRLREVGDLPRGVILQWRRWCLNHVGQVGARRIGHFGFFRVQSEATLWQRTAALFQRFATGAPA